MISRTYCAVKMNGSRLRLAAAVLQALLVTAHCGHHRRSMAAQASLSSKGGWRPVVGSNGIVYNSFGASPLHAPVQNYKIPVPVLDLYQSSARPLVSRDANKVTSIAQSYRPTTHKTVPTPQPLSQPVNSYHNPFAIQNNAIFPNNALSYYKHVQTVPLDSVVIRNPHNPYAARPVFQKYPQKVKQQFQNNALQQLSNIQPIHFGQYQTAKPIDIFGQSLDFSRPNDAKKQQAASNSGIEMFKPEVFKLPDSDTASQSVQQVKTVQQQGFGSQSHVYNTFPQYSFQDALFPPSILGSFGSFGVQSVKGRDHVFPSTKATFLPQQQSAKTTVFNSFNYSPNFKTTPAVYAQPSTTPRLPNAQNQINFASTYNDFKITPTPQTKVSPPPKIDPNANSKDSFKPSPQDPFIKNYQNDYNKVTTYNPVQTTTNTVYEYNYEQSQYINPNYYNQQSPQKVTNKKHSIHDSIPAGGNQQVVKQYSSPPRAEKENVLSSQLRPTYEVTETTESDIITHSSPAPWQLTSETYDTYTPEDTVKGQDYSDYGVRPNPTPVPELPEEYAIVTEAEKGYQNSLGYDGHVESQSRRPLGDDFEPIGQHKLKDYYYKVSTPTYDDYSAPRRTKKPTEATKATTTTAAAETTTPSTASSNPIDSLPTLPPNKHFKRPSPSTPEPPTIDKEKIRKRNKIRRRRPGLANLNRNNDQTTRTPLKFSDTTESNEVHTIKPRPRPTNAAKLQSPTTPTVTTDLTTSALPTVSPTSPTIVKKKLANRRPLTTTTSEDKVESTTITQFRIYEAHKESPIMKIANRQVYPKLATTAYEYKTEETPNYNHKEKDKDTPASNVSVFNDNLRASVESELEFAFHKDMKPIEAKLEPVTSRYKEVTTEDDVGNEVTTFAPRSETNIGKIQRPRLRNKYNRPKFSVNDYKNRLASTTTTTEKPVENTQKLRFPQRRIPYSENASPESESTTERKRFTPKEPRNKLNNTENTQEIYENTRPQTRQRQTTPEVEVTTKISARIRNGNRRPKPEENEEPVQTTTTSKRPLRKKIKDSDIEESVQDITVTELTESPQKDVTSERTRSESAIMKIADKKHQDHLENLFEHSKRVSDLTLAASKDYNKQGMFKNVSPHSRRIPNYFTIATDDPILPIEAFFPQLNQKKES